MIRLIFLVFFTSMAGAEPALEITGDAIQGGMLVGMVSPRSTVRVDGEPVPVSSTGHFVVGIDRDREQAVAVGVVLDGVERVHTIEVDTREFDIQRIDGLPDKMVTPPPEVSARIADDAARVRSARTRRDDRVDFLQTFIWPTHGPLSGFYGSQRILNGKPKWPHYGVDVAAPEGAPVAAPAAGIVTLADPDQYYSGGTIIIDHGLGVSSTFLHLSRLDVQPGDIVAQGDRIGAVGSSGRATGPHLDWRMNVGDVRIDPQLLMDGPPPRKAVQQ